MVKPLPNPPKGGKNTVYILYKTQNTSSIHHFPTEKEKLVLSPEVLELMCLNTRHTFDLSKEIKKMKTQDHHKALLKGRLLHWYQQAYELCYQIYR